MSPNKRSTNNLLRRYLSGALTAPEEAELERRALTDEPLAEAMRGLQENPEADHAASVRRMLQGARSQVQGTVKEAKVRSTRRNYARFAAVASVLILFVSCALWFLPQWIEMNPGDMAMSPKTEAPAANELDRVVEDKPKMEAQPPKIAPKPTATVIVPAPSSPTPNPRPRPNTPPAAEQKTEMQARERDAAKAKRAQNPRQQTTIQDPAIATAQTSPSMDDEGAIVEEEISIPETTPPPAPQVTAAPMAAPLPSVTTDLIGEDALSGAVSAAAGGGRGNYLEGRITNENGVPVFSALVRLPGLPLGERTDSSGYFRIPADATTTQMEVSHPDYEGETVDLRNRPESLQISLDRKEWQPNMPDLIQSAAYTKIKLDDTPGYAAPLEGYGTLRKRLEANRPTSLPAGKVKFSFTVNTDGTLTDFEFRGNPDRLVMDYIGKTLVTTSVWEIMQGEEPVRVYMKVVF